MASEIERALYGELADRVLASGEVGDHCLLELSVSITGDATEIRVRVAPWGREYSRGTEAAFNAATLLRIAQVAADPEELELPWGIVGFHSRPDGDTWHFILNTRAARVEWASAWPTIRPG